jgi:DNA primase
MTNVIALRRRSTGERKDNRAIDIPRMLKLLGIQYKDHNGELWANCPFPDHEEDTPSWSMKPTGQHYCFGCKKGGGAANLVMRVYDFKAYASAMAWLDEHGLFSDGKLPLEVDVVVSRPALDRPEVQVPTDARFVSFAEWKVTVAKRYAQKRGITAAQVDKWGIGYATGGYYANRLLLPTREYMSGRLINITGRAWSPTKTPKYLNSKEQHGWDPGAVFGEQHWGPYLGSATLVLCEGELNALACERVGAQYVGALGGSTLDKEQVLKLSTFLKVIIAVDIDRAGTEVAEALRATLARWRKAVVVQFPDRRDPNDLEREDPQLLKRLLWAR